MKKEFDFDDIGKQIPYRTPESFFDDNRRDILKRTCGEERRKKNRLKFIIPTTLVAAALVAGLLFMPLFNKEEAIPAAPASDYVLAVGVEPINSETMDLFIESLSDEELYELTELSESDVFLF